MTTPSLAQMVTRANEGHYKALYRLAAGRPVVSDADSLSAYRGMRTVLATLSRWECIDLDLDGSELLTERGRALLDALSARWPDMATWMERDSERRVR